MERFLKIPHQTFLRVTQVAQKKNCPAVILVYLALLYHSDNYGRCFPGYKRIREIAGVKGDATVSRALRVLEEEGLLVVERDKGCVNRYQLTGYTPSITEEPSSIIEEPTSSVNEEHPFNHCRTPLHSLKNPLQSLKNTSSMIEDELDPFNYNQYNYNHLTIPNELKEKGREKNGRYRKFFGPPENPEDDWEYYGFSR